MRGYLFEKALSMEEQFNAQKEEAEAAKQSAEEALAQKQEEGDQLDQTITQK